MKKIFLLFPFLMLMAACTTTRFTDIKLQKVEKVAASKLIELENVNLSRAGNGLLKVSFTSNYDFSKSGRQNMKESGNFSKMAYICESRFSLGFFFGNAEDRIDVDVGDIYSDRKNIISDESLNLSAQKEKTYYFFITTKSEIIYSKTESLNFSSTTKDIHIAYDLEKEPKDICFHLIIGYYMYGHTSNGIRISKEAIEQALK